MPPTSPTESFHWSESSERLSALLRSGDFELESRGRFFEGAGVCVWPPLVFPVAQELVEAASDPKSAAEAAARKARRAGRAPGADLAQYVQSLPAQPGRQCLILWQAGAASLGFFDAGEPLATKTLKRYVVRGKGHAQPGYLASKGKSRYGSRLRLQNARLLIDEINVKLHGYWSEFGAPELIFAGAPVRLWPDLFRAKQLPPFTTEDRIVRVPFDLPVPTTEVLLRTYKKLCYGRVVGTDPEQFLSGIRSPRR